MELEEESTDVVSQIIVKSGFFNDKPCVIWTLENDFGILSPLQARESASILFQAAAIAEAEAQIFLALMDKTNGFGVPKLSKEAQRLIERVRLNRTPLPNGIRPIFGHRGLQPLVEIDWYGRPLCEDLNFVRHHATSLTQAAEAAETDSFLNHFFANSLGLDRSETDSVIEEFSRYRNSTRLESLKEI